MSNKSFNKGFNTGYEYSDFVERSKRGNANSKRIQQKMRRKKLDKIIEDQLSEMQEETEET